MLEDLAHLLKTGGFLDEGKLFFSLTRSSLDIKLPRSHKSAGSCFPSTHFEIFKPASNSYYFFFFLFLFSFPFLLLPFSFTSKFLPFSSSFSGVQAECSLRLASIFHFIIGFENVTLMWEELSVIEQTCQWSLQRVQIWIPHQRQWSHSVPGTSAFSFSAPADPPFWVDYPLSFLHSVKSTTTTWTKFSLSLLTFQRDRSKQQTSSRHPRFLA